MRREITALAVFFALAHTVSACQWCRAQARSDVYDADFIGNLFLLLLPILILGALGFGLYRADKILNRIRRLK